jgi:regulator of nucleoside diphosphate kinase
VRHKGQAAIVLHISIHQPEREDAMNNAKTIVITEADMERLDDLINSWEFVQRRDQEHLSRLKEELGRAEVLDGNRVPGSVVMMNSHVKITDLDDGRRHQYQLVFPRAANISQNRISVLAPIGIALLGYREGSEVEWKVPGGMRRFRIEQVRNEAARHVASAEAA